MSLRIFPFESRKFARLTPKQAYEGLAYLIREDLKSKIQSEQDTAEYIKGKIGGAIGATVNIRIFPEDGSSLLLFSFSYRILFFIIFVILAAAVGLSFTWNTVIPMIGIVVIFPLAYKVNAAVLKFLDTVNETLPHLEQEYARIAFKEERERWQREPKDTKDLYRRLREKYLKTWGNTYALEYKIAEYVGQGLTREEAIRKTAEEEGIY